MVETHAAAIAKQREENGRATISTAIASPSGVVPESATTKAPITLSTQKNLPVSSQNYDDISKIKKDDFVEDQIESIVGVRTKRKRMPNGKVLATIQ